MKQFLEVRPVKGYEGYYASEMGDIYSTKLSETPRRMQQIQHSLTGYFQVGVKRNGKEESAMVHRLVAFAFLDGEGEVVNHINGCRWDNRLENLEWCSQRDNCRHHFQVLKKNIGDDHWNTVISVSETPKLAERYADGESLSSIARAYGISEQTVGRRLKAIGIPIRQTQRRSFVGGVPSDTGL